jgi:hypothetical protein
VANNTITRSFNKFVANVVRLTWPHDQQAIGPFKHRAAAAVRAARKMLELNERYRKVLRCKDFCANTYSPNRISERPARGGLSVCADALPGALFSADIGRRKRVWGLR